MPRVEEYLGKCLTTVPAENTEAFPLCQIVTRGLPLELRPSGCVAASTAALRVTDNSGTHALPYPQGLPFSGPGTRELGYMPGSRV